MIRTSLKKLFKKTLKIVLLLVVVSAIIPFLLDIPQIHGLLQHRFQSRLEKALSHSLGRTVNGGELDFTTVSGLGFNMKGVSVGEAPGFGGEPFLYAENVHFVLSWRSLLSGQFEISRITLRQASLNLVRNGEGRWNFETWFRSDGVATAANSTLNRPGTSPAPTLHDRDTLPFRIGLDLIRVNFKNLQASSEKQVFFLGEISGKIEPAWFSNAIDFDLQVKPARTDVPMENSGMVRVAGSLGPIRASTLWPTVIQGQVKVEKFPYSDVVALLTGHSTSWHGLFQGRASFQGPLNDLISINGQLTLLDLHSRIARPRDRFVSAILDFPRLELRIGKSLSLKEAKATTGSSQFKVAAHLEPLADPKLDLSMESEKLSLGDVLELVRGFTRGIPASTQLLGEARFKSNLEGSWKGPVLDAEMSISGGSIQSQYLSKSLSFSPFDVTLQNGVLNWTPVRLGGKGSYSFQVGGSLANLSSTPQWTFDMSGRDVPVQNIENIGLSFGYWPTSAHLEGIADVSLQWGSPRKQSTISVLRGHIFARSLTARVGATEEVHIASARFEARKESSQLTATKVNWGRSVASGTLQFQGLDFHRAQVNLNASFLDLNELLRLGDEARRQLFPAAREPDLSPIDFSSRPAAIYTWAGRLSSSWLYFKKLQFTNVRSDFIFENKSLRMANFALEVYGGKGKGRFQLDWGELHPHLRVEGQVDNSKLDAWLEALTPLGPAVQGRASGEFLISGEKAKDKPWGQSLTAHVQASLQELKNIRLAISPSVQELKTRLNLGSASTAKDAPLNLQLTLDYGPERYLVNDARLTRGGVTASFSGTCTRNLDLNLTGTAEKIATLNALPTPTIPLQIRGPLDHAEIILSPLNAAH
jgi:uncharacterized protein involved in outer membrane biogenesis